MSVSEIENISERVFERESVSERVFKRESVSERVFEQGSVSERECKTQCLYASFILFISTHFYSRISTNSFT